MSDFPPSKQVPTLGDKTLAEFRLLARLIPRKVICDTFDSLDLPISGGWGYSMSDAVVIDRDDKSVNPNLPFHGVGVERQFVLHRLYLELITARSTETSYAGISWKLTRQYLHQDSGKTYDRLDCKATALPYLDWLELKNEWEGPNGYGSDGFDEQKHLQHRETKTVNFPFEVWFDISSFYGRRHPAD